jgi:hypothetical protein
MSLIGSSSGMFRMKHECHFFVRRFHDICVSLDPRPIRLVTQQKKKNTHASTMYRETATDIVDTKPNTTMNSFPFRRCLSVWLSTLSLSMRSQLRWLSESTSKVMSLFSMRLFAVCSKVRCSSISVSYQLILRRLHSLRSSY